METASDIRVGAILKIDNQFCKVLTQEVKGTGKFGKTIHAKLKNLEDGHVKEKSWRAEEAVEKVEGHRVKMQYSYKDGDQFIFMNMETFEQFPVNADTIGKQEIFLKENMEIDVEFVEEKPVHVAFPATAELKVSSAPPGTKGGSDSTYKEVELENGLKVLTPQFIKEGDSIHIDTNTFDYLDRVSKKTM